MVSILLHLVNLSGSDCNYDVCIPLDALRLLCMCFDFVRLSVHSCTMCAGIVFVCM